MHLTFLALFAGRYVPELEASTIESSLQGILGFCTASWLGRLEENGAARCISSPIGRLGNPKADYYRVLRV